MAATDRAIVYLHGFPGGPGELALFGATPGWASRAFSPNRTADRPDLTTETYFDDLTDRASSHAAGRSLHLVGFSLGARVALEIAARLTGQVAQIDLISPAGPLDGNDHLRLMAGKLVFGMAISKPRLFNLQTAAQAWIARKRPGLLYRALFGADGEAGLNVSGFRDRATVLLRDCFSQGTSGYTREVLAYVAPWSWLPERIATPTRIWQGSADDWTPPPMAENLQSLLPQAELLRIPGKSHYGTLHHALTHLSA